MKAKQTSKWKKMRGTDWRWATYTFNYAPPSETETKLEALNDLIKPLEKLLRFLEGFRSAKEFGPVTIQEVAALAGVIKLKKAERDELRRKADHEKQAKAKKSKK